MDQQRSVDFGEAFEDGGVGGEVFAHFHKGADDKDAHGNRARSAENVGGHEGVVLREGDREMADVAFGCGRKLRPDTCIVL